jgi:hypothetical protein
LQKTENNFLSLPKQSEHMLKELIEKTQLSELEIASALFPGRKHAVLAYRRVMAGKAHLDMDQLDKLMTLAGGSLTTALSEHFDGVWKSKPNKDGNLVLAKKDWSVEIEPDGTAHISKSDEVKKIQVLYNKTITMHELLKALNKIIETL